VADRIEVGFKPDIMDALGERVKKQIIENLNLVIKSVRTFQVYTIDAEITDKDLSFFAAGPLSDPVIQDWSVNRMLANNFDWAIEIGFKPGVTDNVGKTARESLGLLLGRELKDEERVYTSIMYAIEGNITQMDAELIFSNLLGNQLIHRCIIISGHDLAFGMGIDAIVPSVKGKYNDFVNQINLNVNDEQLIKISQDGILALDLKEMYALKKYINNPDKILERKNAGIGKDFTDIEIEALAQTWSEHCKHKIFSGRISYFDNQGKCTIINSLFDTYIKGSTEKIRTSLGMDDYCLSVFKDNAGVVKFTKDYNIVMKVETHNSPSALDPYGGALTGIVGVNRDPFGTGMGAKLIANTDVFCFANPDFDKDLPPRLLHPKRIFMGVREGVEHGGNKSGIPTVNGAIVFDDRYAGKPLVYCGTVGLMPKELHGKPAHEKKAMPGDLIVMVGGRIGKDGIHGATFSSEELHEGSPATAVQIGDPITQKKMTDFLLVARDKGLYNCITDNGAGGLSSSVGEMAQDTGGFILDLEKAPLKYNGLAPWEILLSEAQERMTVSVAFDKIEAFLELSKKMEVESTVIGVFTQSGYFHVRFNGKTVAYLEMDFIHNGVPVKEMTARWKLHRHSEPKFPLPKNHIEKLKTMLSRLNICSRESVIRQYDHEVQGGSVIKPLVGETMDGPGDAAVIRPLLDSMAGIVISNGICPRYSDIDTYHMVSNAIDEAVRNAVCVGARPDRMAGLDNFCWCDPIVSDKNPDGEYKLAQLVRANQALFDFSVAYNIPCISGKDSMKNDYSIGDIRISIPPTVLFSLVGNIDDVRKAVTSDFKSSGDMVYILGITRPELGGSEYFALHGFTGNNVPQVRPETAKKLYGRIHKAINMGLIRSCHDCSDGGIGVAMVESLFPGKLGLKVDLSLIPTEDIKRDDYLLYSETPSRFIVSINPDKKEAFESLMDGLDWSCIGIITPKDILEVKGLNGDIIMKTPVSVLKDAWQRPLRDF